MKFLKTISVEKFKEILQDLPKISLGEEKLALGESFDRVVSQDIKSPIDVPHFRKSRMDGYAVIAQDTFGAEETNSITLNVVDTIEAGDVPTIPLKQGECAYVATGAAIPENANAVVMVEFSERVDDKVEITKAVTPNTYIVEIGLDVKKEEVVVEKGTKINLPTMGILASCGLSMISVFKRPKVGLISTGNELVSHAVKELEVGKIYDVNSVVLKRAIQNTGAEVNYLGIVKDDFEDLKDRITKGIKESDIVILSGGTSKGEGDLGPKVLETFKNIELQVHGVKIKPGKPIIFAKLEEKMIFILPGYPTSALSCFYVFMDDFLRNISGYPSRFKTSQLVEVGERIYSPIGRHHFKAVEMKNVDGTQKIFPIKTGSEAISTLFYADGYIEIDELEEILEKGDKTYFHRF
ncbi:MAG: Molybdopterin molybdenumtransferase [Promethearchaeota archaeon]|nr:MAG: Molybdopterin molybdenumtransferase [Candidatus Lokiarchaeota archaeon]